MSINQNNKPKGVIKKKCAGSNKDGKPCRNYPLVDRKYCERHQKKYNSNRFIGWLSIVLTLGFGYYAYWYNDNLEKNSGTLDPIRIQKNEFLVKKFAVGSTFFEIDSNDGVWLIDDNLPLIQLKIHKNKLLVTAEIFDEQYKKISYISDNEWYINDNNYERQYTDNIVEVKNQSGEVVLQAIHYGNTVHLAFQLYTRNHWRITLIPEFYTLNGYRGASLTSMLDNSNVFNFDSIQFLVPKKLTRIEKIDLIKHNHPKIGSILSIEPYHIIPF